MEVDTIFYRYGAPSSLDQLPYGTFIHVVKDKEIEVYLQNSNDENNPQWILKEIISRD